MIIFFSFYLSKIWPNWLIDFSFYLLLDGPSPCLPQHCNESLDIVNVKRTIFVQVPCSFLGSLNFFYYIFCFQRFSYMLTSHLFLSVTPGTDLKNLISDVPIRFLPWLLSPLSSLPCIGLTSGSRYMPFSCILEVVCNNSIYFITFLNILFQSYNNLKNWCYKSQIHEKINLFIFFHR